MRSLQLPKAHNLLKVKAALEIYESVLQRLREEAERRKTTVSDLADGMLRLGLAMLESSETAPTTLPPFPIWRSGGFRVDIADREALYQVLDEA